MLSLYELKKILNPKQDSTPEDDFRIIQSWAEYDEKSSKPPEERNLKYLCYELEVMNPDTGEITHFYKAIKFARVIRLPANAKQSTAFMDMQEQILAGVHERNYNMITIIANVIKPVALGLLYLYGIQGVAESLEKAKEKAYYDFKGFVGMLQGTFRVLEIKCVEAQETEWLREKMYNMDYMTVVRGIPKANKAGEDAGNRGMGGSNINPDSQGTLEEMITGMADYEYVIEVLSTPVYLDTLTGWQRQSQKEMTAWYSQLQGTKSLSMNLSIPMMYMANASQSQGWSKAYTDANSVSYAHGESFSQSEGQSVGESLSRSFGQSIGHSQGQSLTNSVSHGLSTSHGVSFGESFGHNTGISAGMGTSANHGTNVGAGVNSSQGMNASEGLNASHGTNTSQGINSSHGTNQSMSMNESQGYSEGTNVSQSHGYSQGSSYNLSHGQNVSTSHNLSHSQNVGYGESESMNVGNSASYGQSSSNSFSQNLGESFNFGKNYGVSQNHGVSSSHGTNSGTSNNVGANGGLPMGIAGVNGSHGWSNGTSDSAGTSMGYGSSYGSSYGHGLSSGISNGITNGQSTSIGASMSHGNSVSHNVGYGASESYGTSVGESVSQGWGVNQSESTSQSIGHSVGMSSSVGRGYSMGQSQSVGESLSMGQSDSMGMSRSLGSSVSMGSSLSTGASQSEGVSANVGQSAGESYSQNVGQNYGVSQSETLGQSMGQSVSDSVTQSASSGYGETVGRTQGVSNGQSYTSSNGTSKGTSNGTSGTMTSGTSSSMGLGPSIGYSKSYQWLDQGVKDLLELMEFQNERIKKALRGQGAFYTYVYIGCPSLDALSTAQAVAKSTWQNEYAMVEPIQVLDLSETEQKHLLYHFAAFSADVTREDVFGVQQYKYCTVLLPEEYTAYTHLPRVSEGGVFSIVQDIPKFSVPSMLKGEIYMGTILNPERWTFENGYRTQFDYRIAEETLLHGFFTGASRSGKTVAAIRFIAELSKVRRKKTGKRLRIVAMDPKQDWRTLARFVEPERFKFYSMGNVNFRPIKLNPWKIPKGVYPQIWIDGVIDIYCRAYGLLERGKQMIADVVFELYEEAGVMKAIDKEDWKETVPELSKQVNFAAIYKRMEKKKDDLDSPGKGRAGNDTRDAYARLLDRLNCFDRKYSIESRLYGTSDGLGIDDLIGDDDVTVLESKGLENTFKNFIFGVITSGFYKFALAHEGGFLAEDQYETVLVIEEANEVLTGNDCAGTGGGQTFGMSGQSEFEQILDQSAGYGLFIMAITQKIADMPSSIIANSGLVFAGRLKRTDDINVVVRTVGREERIDDRDLVKWFPRSPTGWFVCQTSRTFDFKDAEPILVQISRLNINPPSNLELDEILIQKEAEQKLKSA